MSAESSRPTIPDSIGNLEVRQHLLEDGTILDIPAAVLCCPPPKPIEFLYLKHYYQTRSGVKQELREAESAEVAVDILANELEGMRHLLSGYVHTFEQYVEKFDAEHDAIRTDIASIVESYNGLRKIVKAVSEHAPIVDAAFLMMEQKVRKLHMHARMPAPPKIVRREAGNGLKNPRLTNEEQKVIYRRFRDHKAHEDNLAFVDNIRGYFKDKELVTELTTRPSRPQSDADSAPAPAPAPAPVDNKKKRADKGKGKAKAKEVQPSARSTTPIDPRVEVKIEKLAKGLGAMREAFQRIHTKTEQDLVHLRVLSKKEKTVTQEIWVGHDQVEGCAFGAGKTTSRTQRGIEAYDRWATKCLEDQEAEASQAAKAAAEADSAENAPASQGSSATGGEVYTVSLNLKYEKNLDKLTREEAIDMLKALPLRIHFTPFGSAEDEGATTTNDHVPDLQAAGQSGSNFGDDVASEAGQPPVAKKSKAGAESRKRARTEPEDAGEKHVDPRAVAGGSPVKKKRVHKE